LDQSLLEQYIPPDDPPSPDIQNTQQRFLSKIKPIWTKAQGYRNSNKKFTQQVLKKIGRLRSAQDRLYHTAQSASDKVKKEYEKLKMEREMAALKEMEEKAGIIVNNNNHA